MCFERQQPLPPPPYRQPRPQPPPQFLTQRENLQTFVQRRVDEFIAEVASRQDYDHSRLIFDVRTEVALGVQDLLGNIDLQIAFYEPVRPLRVRHYIEIPAPIPLITESSDSESTDAEYDDPASSEDSSPISDEEASDSDDSSDMDASTDSDSSARMEAIVTTNHMNTRLSVTLRTLDNREMVVPIPNLYPGGRAAHLPLQEDYEFTENMEVRRVMSGVREEQARLRRIYSMNPLHANYGGQPRIGESSALISFPMFNQRKYPFIGLPCQDFLTALPDALKTMLLKKLDTPSLFNFCRTRESWMDLVLDDYDSRVKLLRFHDSFTRYYILVNQNPTTGAIRTTTRLIKHYNNFSYSLVHNAPIEYYSIPPITLADFINLPLE